MSDDKLSALKKLLTSAKSALASAEEILRGLGVDDLGAISSHIEDGSSSGSVSADGKVIEGMFNGEKMIGPDKREYPVPANYASKSKLVPGDGLKLTITDDGKFLYKQIRPVSRKTVVGTLIKDGAQFGVMADDKMYRVLLASVTYHKAHLGDQITLVVSEDSGSDWGAIEAVLPQSLT
jgi:hypothetical protein